MTKSKLTKLVGGPNDCGFTEAVYPQIALYVPDLVPPRIALYIKRGDEYHFLQTAQESELEVVSTPKPDDLEGIN